VLIKIINRVLSNPILKTLITYYLISLLIWLPYLTWLNIRKTKQTGMQHSNAKVANRRRLSTAPIILSIIVLLLYIGVVLHYVGYLPYGPDTNGYTYVPIKLASAEGHWLGKGYYKPFHTSAIMYTIAYWITSSYQYAYIVLVCVIALCLTLMVSLAVARLLRTTIRYVLGLAVALFLLTPCMGGLDLLQQYIATVYGISALSTLLISLRRNKLNTLIPFLIFTAICIITHLTPVLIALLFMFVYLAVSKEKLLILCSTAMIAISIIYSLYAVAPEITFLQLINMFRSLEEGSITSPTIRAYEEMPLARIGLFSWTLLPAMASSYIVLTLLMHVHSYVKRRQRASLGRIDALLFLSLLYSITLLLLAFISKFTGVDLSRYFWLLSYNIMYFLITMLLTYLLTKRGKSFMAILLLLLLFMPYAYSAYNDHGRNPRAGELRLAPITYWDRVEMLPLALYGCDGYYVVAWHDVRIPIEWSNRTPFLKSLFSSYYPGHDILLKVALDEKVKVPIDTYLILHKKAIKSSKFSNYNIVLNSREHIVLLPAYR